MMANEGKMRVEFGMRLNATEMRPEFKEQNWEQPTPVRQI